MSVDLAIVFHVVNNDQDVVGKFAGFHRDLFHGNQGGIEYLLNAWDLKVDR